MAAKVVRQAWVWAWISHLWLYQDPQPPGALMTSSVNGHREHCFRGMLGGRSVLTWIKHCTLEHCTTSHTCTYSMPHTGHSRHTGAGGARPCRDALKQMQSWSRRVSTTKNLAAAAMHLPLIQNSLFSGVSDPLLYKALLLLVWAFLVTQW